MTWEWVVFLSVLMVCGSAIFVYLSSKEEKEPPKLEEIIDIQKQINELAASQEACIKIAEESKKLLSQNNLAIGFIPRRRVEAK